MGLHRIYYGMLREGEEREESRLPGSSPGKLCVFVCTARESRMRLLVYLCSCVCFMRLSVLLCGYLPNVGVPFGYVPDGDTFSPLPMDGSGDMEQC